MYFFSKLGVSLGALMMTAGGCVHQPVSHVPKTPEQNTISGVLTKTDQASHRVSCPSREQISIKLSSTYPKVTFDVISSETGEPVFIGSGRAFRTRWTSEPNCEPNYIIRVYNSESVSKPLVSAHYQLTVTRTD